MPRTKDGMWVDASGNPILFTDPNDPRWKTNAQYHYDAAKGYWVDKYGVSAGQYNDMPVETSPGSNQWVWPDGTPLGQDEVDEINQQSYGNPPSPGATDYGVHGSWDISGISDNTLKSDAPGAELETSNPDEDRAQTQAYIDALRQRASTGEGPWEDALRSATSQAQASAMALGQSTPGVESMASVRGITNAQAGATQRAAGEAEKLRAQTRQQATQELDSVLGAQGALDAQQAAAVAAARQARREANNEILGEAQRVNMGIISGAGQGIAGLAKAAGGLSDGGTVPGRARTFGDDEANDTVPAWLSPGEIVIPRSVAQSPDAPDAAAAFVEALKTRGGGSDGPNYDAGGSVHDSSVRPGGTGLADDVMGLFGPRAEQQAASIDNGGRLDTTQYNTTRFAALDNSDSFLKAFQGQGPSLAPQLGQEAQDETLAAAMAAGAGTKGAGRAAGLSNVMSAAGIEGAKDASGVARTVAEESGAGGRAYAAALQRQRQQDLALAQAQQQAAWRNSMMNSGISLAAQAQIRGLLGGVGQAFASGADALSDWGEDYGDEDYGDWGDDGGGEDYGDDIGDFDLGSDDWDDASYAADGGEVTDDGVKGTSFLDALKSAGLVVGGQLADSVPAKVLGWLDDAARERSANTRTAHLEPLKGSTREEVFADLTSPRREAARDALAVDEGSMAGPLSVASRGALLRAAGELVERYGAKGARGVADLIEAAKPGSRGGYQAGTGTVRLDPTVGDAIEAALASGRTDAAGSRALRTFAHESLHGASSPLVGAPSGVGLLKASPDSMLEEVSNELVARDAMPELLRRLGVEAPAPGPLAREGGVIQLPRGLENFSDYAPGIRRFATSVGSGADDPLARIAAAAEATKRAPRPERWQTLAQLHGGQATPETLKAQLFQTPRRGYADGGEVLPGGVPLPPGFRGFIQPGESPEDAAARLGGVYAETPQPPGFVGLVRPGETPEMAAARLGTPLRGAPAAPAPQPGTPSTSPASVVGQMVPGATPAPAPQVGRPGPVTAAPRKAAPPREDFYGQERQAVEAMGELQQEEARQRADAQAAYVEQLQQHQLVMAEKRTRAQQQAEEHFAGIQQAREQMRAISVDIDPGRWWASRSTPGKVMAAIGLALGAIGAGNDGVNRAAGIIENAVARDLEAQRAEHELRLRKGQADVDAATSIYGLHRQMMGDDIAATDAAKGSALELARAQVDLAAAKVGSPMAKQQALMLSAQLGQKAQEFDAATKQRSFENYLKVEDMKTRRLAAMPQGGGERVKPADYGHDFAAPGYHIAPGAKPAAEELKKWRSALAEKRSADKTLNELKHLISSSALIPLSDEAARAESLVSDLKIAYKNIAALGALTVSDYALIENAIPDPTSLRSRAAGDDTLNKRLDQFLATANIKFDENTRVLGIEKDGEGQTAAGTAEETQEALKWLQANPNSPDAPTVRARLQREGAL